MGNLARSADEARWAGVTSPVRGSFSAEDCDFVRRQRRQGASWGAVAKMLGRPEPTVRAHFDRPIAAPLEPEPEPAPPKTEITSLDVGEGRSGQSRPSLTHPEAATPDKPKRAARQQRHKAASSPKACSTRDDPHVQVSPSPAPRPTKEKLAAWRIALGDLAVEPMTSKQLGELNGWSTPAAGLTLCQLADKGLAWKTTSGRWEITGQGRARIAELGGAR